MRVYSENKDFGDNNIISNIYISFIYTYEIIRWQIMTNFLKDLFFITFYEKGDNKYGESSG